MTLCAMPQEKTVLAPATVSAENVSFRSATQLGKIIGIHDARYEMSGGYAYQSYKFEIEASQINIVLDYVGTHAPNMFLYTPTNRLKVGGTVGDIDLITQSVKIDSREQRIHIDGLGAGTYYLVVARSRLEHVSLGYRLTIYARPSQPMESEYNNTASTAHRIGGKADIPLVGQRIVHGNISGNGGDAADFYQFTLTQPSYVQAFLSLVSSGSRVVLEILDANQRSLKTLSLSPPGLENYVACDRLPAGTYYAYIRPVGPTNTRYTLTLEGVPVKKGKFTVRMHRITALDDFETWRRGGRGRADFYYQLLIEGRRHISHVFEESNDRQFGYWGQAERKSEYVDIEQRLIDFSISLREDDPRNDDHADINPISGLRNLSLVYDTLTGEVSGQGLSVHKEGEKITVQGNEAPRARITFEVKYETISTGDIDP